MEISCEVELGEEYVHWWPFVEFSDSLINNKYIKIIF